jgi:hypothetical protein
MAWLAAHLANMYQNIHLDTYIYALRSACKYLWALGGSGGSYNFGLCKLSTYIWGYVYVCPKSWLAKKNFFVIQLGAYSL